MKITIEITELPSGNIAIESKCSYGGTALERNYAEGIRKVITAAIPKVAKDAGAIKAAVYTIDPSRQ